MAAERIRPPNSKLGVLHSDEALPDSVVLVAVTSNVTSRLLTGEFPQINTGRTGKINQCSTVADGVQ